jgi:hypothetical protein
VRQLPGIRFETLTPPVSDDLPRMDIAAFVGFTASGPISVPVAVEDITQFADIFGADIAIARTDAHGDTTYGYVAPAVRAFFRNGGRRCWVVRVAGVAVSNQFRVPGLTWVGSGLTLQPAFAVARSEGSWSDSLVLRTSMSSQTMPLLGVSLAAGFCDFPASARDAILPGELLRFTQRTPGQTPVVYLATVSKRISATRVALDEVFYGSGADPDTWLPWLGGSPPNDLITADWFGERLRFEMVVEDADNRATRLQDLAFGSAHPRYWASLLTDAELFAAPGTPAGLIADPSNPRFPLAGAQRDALFLPVKMPFLFSDPQGPEPLTATALERDGLGKFSADLFLDPQLREAGAMDLISEADYIRYQSSQPRPLTGIHATLAIDEATIVCVPDAVQRSWSRSVTPPPDPPIPSPPLQRPDWFPFLNCRTKPPIPLVTKPPFDHFLNCSIQAIDAPALANTLPDAHGSFQLSWSATVAGGTYILEQAAVPGFSGAEELYRGSGTVLKLYGYAPGVYYYRVRVEAGGNSSDYSNGVVIRIAHTIDWLLDPVEQYDDRDLLDVQGALIRMCAARGDLLALLAMPQHYRELDALSHVAKLVSAPPGTSDAAAFSYGAIYHPWLTGREENQLDVLRTSPPEGAIAGTLASRSLNRGAWIAPANEPLHGVVDFSAPVSPVNWQALQDAQVNVIRQDPAGFLCLDSDTLSLDPDVQPINVRRLMMLLRKTALRFGTRYVFEPSSDAFRRSVQRGFESVLETMFLRGAFSGRTPSSAFQVVTDATLNTPQSVEQGRFIVDLKVAPSVPLTFLTVRLLQTADRASVTEGVGG